MVGNEDVAITFNFAKASVAMIDPSPLCLEVMTGILAGYGFRKLHRCADLPAGTDLVKVRPIDLILIDPYPFGEVAYDFVRWLRSDQRNGNSASPIVIVTAQTCVRLITAARQCGADYVIVKPFSTAGLLERILWVAESDGRRGELIAPTDLVSTAGSGVELW